MKLALRFSYLGDRFFGSQMQPGLRTVEGEFIEACRRLDLFEDWRAAGFATAGRTDRGVHARGQVCAFRTVQPDRARRVLNLMLPPDIWCTGWAAVPDAFHPRHDAVARTYRYYFPEPPPDITAMQEVARSFQGSHDFSSFARTGDRCPRRTVLDARVFEEGRFAVFEVTAESFLWNMVRCMATALDRVGRGAVDGEDIVRLLEEPAGHRLPAAPPDGLILWHVECGIEFDPLPMDEKSRKYLASLRRHHALMERVSTLLGELG